MTCVFDTTRIMDIEGYSCILSDLEYDFSTPFYFIRITGDHMDGMTNEDVRLIRITNSRINRIPANIFNVFPNAEAMEVKNYEYADHGHEKLTRISSVFFLMYSLQFQTGT